MTTPMQNFMYDFMARPPASAEALRAAEQSIGKTLPEDYKAFLLEHNGGDGFIGTGYFILWRAEELCKFNDGYEVSKYAPGLVLFGSNGGGDGFAFDTRASPYRVMQVPFVGMSRADEFRVAGSFAELLMRQREKKAHSSQRSSKSNPTLRGKEMFEIKPIILGGSPTDPENKVALTRDQHMEVVRYWNKLVSNLRNQ
jgi:cell wall assembly regulator SMI1